MRKFFIFCFLLSVIIIAQNKDPKEIIKKAEMQFEKVKDYSADITIKVDLEFLKMNDSKAKIYFKAPDKYKLDSDGFAMLPKEGITYNPAKFTKGDFTSVYIKDDKIDNNDCYVVKIIPNSDSLEIVLTTLYIDKNNYFIRKVESATKRGGTIKINLTYNSNKQYPLPDKVQFGFNIENMNKKDEINDPDKNIKRQMRNKDLTGNVYIYYNNYKVNTGLSDKIFETKKNKK